MIGRALDRTTTVWLACAASLVLGLIFVFVWSPLPWGWLGIDFYHDRAVRLAAGEPFDTTDVPWGYAYYVALFYAAFGPHPWLPLVGQVLLNATIPAIVYRLALPLTGQRTAVAAALLIGVFSFNTIYTATLSSDSVCTVLFLTSLLLFAHARAKGGRAAFAAGGLLAGLAPQFRPNLILYPPIQAAWHVVTRRQSRALGEAAVYLALAAAALVPWTVRNYSLTRSFLPTSTHGAIQLWYGTLQTGEHLESRADNPRSLFEAPAFPYTSLEFLPIVVTADVPWCAPADSDVVLRFHTDRDPHPATIRPAFRDGKRLTFELPGQPSPTTIYYSFLSSRGPSSEESVYFVSTDHLGDLDRHGALFDVFDVIRLVRWLAWREPIHDEAAVDADGNNDLTEADLTPLVARLLRLGAHGERAHDLVTLEQKADSATLRLADGSSLTVPREFSGQVTDLVAQPGLAATLLHARARPAARAEAAGHEGAGACGSVDAVAANNVFYRREPHLMRRYTALAWDNIRREPAAFAAASLYRMLRMFVIQGSGDKDSAQQFSGSRLIYAAAFCASVAYLLLFAIGAIIAWRRRSPVRSLLLPIAYVPLTICLVLTNMRYTVTVQPLMFVFVAIALTAALKDDTRG